MRLDPETNPAHDLAGQRAAVRIDYGYDDSGNRKAIDDVRILSGTRSLSIGLLLTMAYTGGLGVSNSGLYYAQQRYYDPHLGRWLTPDPIGFSGGLNLYTAMDNDPVGRVDPAGMDPFNFDPYSFGGGLLIGAGEVAAGGALGLAIALVAPEAAVPWIMRAALAYFAVNASASSYEICTGRDFKGNKLPDGLRSQEAGELTAALMSFGFTKLPFMKVGTENAPSYYAMGTRGRCQYEFRRIWRTKNADGSFGTFNFLGAFSPTALGTGPTPGSRLSTQLGGTINVNTLRNTESIIRSARDYVERRSKR